MGLPAYKTARWLLRRLFWMTGGLEVFGKENCPMDGPLIIACNHASYLDPMILGAAFERPMYFMARKTLFEFPVFGWLIRQTLAFPLNREGDSREAIRAFGQLLSEDNAVLIFPEGTRSSDGNLGEIKAGIGMIAARNPAPILPVYIWGSYQSWPRQQKFPHPHHLKVVIGKVIPQVDKEADRKTEQQRIVDDVGSAFKIIEAIAWKGEDSPPDKLLSISPPP